MGGFFFLPVISLGEDYPGVDAMLDLFTEVRFPRVLDPKRSNYIGKLQRD